MTLFIMFLCALNLGLACILVAAEQADENWREIKKNRWDDEEW